MLVCCVKLEIGKTEPFLVVKYVPVPSFAGTEI